MENLDYSKKSEEIIDWIKKTVTAAGFSRVIVAVSGGVDSAVSLHLAVHALGKENVYAILLPYGELSATSLQHGKLVTKAAGLDESHVVVRDIQPAVSSVQSSIINHKSSIMNVRRGNIMARVRMIFTFDLAKELSALVVGTENKSEHYLGYFTRFGDEASDIEPIRSLYKTQVWEMARYLKIPKEIIEKKPSAGLWEGQSDEGEFGFSYEDADRVLFMHFDEEKRNGDIVAAGIDEKIVKSVLSFVEKNSFKRKVPYIIE